MKTQSLYIALLAALAVGCANKNGSSNPAATSTPAPTTPGAPVIPSPGTPYVPPTTGPGQGSGTSFTYGGTTDFVFENVNTYREYTQRYVGSLSELSNIKINVNLDRFDTVYGGTVTIRYTYKGQELEGYFTSGHDKNSNQYNVWFNYFSMPVWHGLFEDFLGGLVLVLDGTTDLLDGFHATDKVSGSVWFKNHYSPIVEHPNTYCWFVLKGDFDCRAWKKKGGINTTQAAEPLSTDGYMKLGTFQNLDLKAAFNNDLQI